MTEQDIFKLVEALEDAAIDFGNRRDSWDRASARDDLRQARTALQEAISKLFVTEADHLEK